MVITYTCITCCVKFATAEIQRDHYKTDWHCFNLKRRVCELAPVTAEDFKNRVLFQQAIKVQEESEINHFCTSCRKQFANQKAFNNHLNSKKHKENLKNKYEKKDDDANNNIDKSFDVSQNEESMHNMTEKLQSLTLADGVCIFCVHTSADLEENLKHMFVAHSFYIPESSNCRDVRGLIGYLKEKVTKDFMCLWCHERKTFHSADSVRKHMTDKGHCHMFDEDIACSEYKIYYDFAPAREEIQLEEKGYELENDVDGCFVYELVLPSGAVIGHRSLLRYYKQFFRYNNALIPHKSPEYKERILYKRDIPLARWHPIFLGQKVRP
ncbi:zinc finger protein 622-like [Teleopsis dalmanni]|uniref:zinc finger protein 622-like n=1 Tax=Teleopsis dalmanni TaxID=139649 RepID=UPI0018CD51C0|nr:zinc finger protein 622-like [Teleopsis dalmanni]